MRLVRTDCCLNIDEFMIADTFSPTRVRVEGNCPICNATDPAGTLVYSVCARCHHIRESCVCLSPLPDDAYADMRSAMNTTDRYPGESQDVRQNEYVQCAFPRCTEITGSRNPDIIRIELRDPEWYCEYHAAMAP